MKMIKLSNNKLYIGTAREIKSLYANMEKHEIAFSIFADEPKFNKLRKYGLYINYDELFEEFPTMEILTASDILAIVLEL